MRRLATTLTLFLLMASPALAAECPKTTLGDVEDEVMCPVCGTSLALATEAPQANRQRRFIERQVAQCRSKSEIKDALAAEFGDSVLALPEDDGFGLAVYVIPPLVLLGAGGVVAFVLLRRRGTPATEGAPPPATKGADEQRLDEDLKRYEL